MTRKLIVVPVLAALSWAAPAFAQPQMSQPQMAQPQMAQPQMAQPELVQPQMAQSQPGEPSAARVPWTVDPQAAQTAKPGTITSPNPDNAAIARIEEAGKNPNPGPRVAPLGRPAGPATGENNSGGR